MSTNGRTSVPVAYTLGDIPRSLLEAVGEWMQACQVSELTFSVHEHKVTLKSTNFYRTTL